MRKLPIGLVQRSTPSAGRDMIIFSFSLVCVSGRVDLGDLLTPHGIWRLLAGVGLFQVKYYF